MDSTHRVFSFSTERVEATVTSRGSIVSSWISNVRSSNSGSRELIVGLDCQWSPKYTTSTMNNRTATLQLCVGTKCLIIQLMHLDYTPKALKNFLRDTNVVFAGVEIERMAMKICGEYGLYCEKYVDVLDFAMELYKLEEKPSLRDLVLKVVGLQIPKLADFIRHDWHSTELGVRVWMLMLLTKFVQSF